MASRSSHAHGKVTARSAIIATLAMALTALIDAGLTDLLLVRFRVFQLLEILGVVELENENPALAIGFAVDQTRVGFERFVYFQDGSFYRRLNVAVTLH